MMLTRKSTKIELDEIDYDEVMSQTPEQEAAADAEFEREQATWEREYWAKINRLTTLQRYRYERHHIIISLLRCRERLDRFAELKAPDFIMEREAAYLKKRQADCLGWRMFLRTGILPVLEKQ